MKKFKLSLRLEIILNMTILMLAMIIFVSVLVTLISKRDIFLKKAEGSLELTHALANMAAPIINYNKDLKTDKMKSKELGQLAKRFFTNLISASVIIADSDGKIFYNSDTGSKSLKVDDAKFFELIKLNTPMTVFKELDKKFIRERPNELYIYYPITENGRPTGGIIAQFSMTQERYYAARTQSIIMLSIVLDAVLFIIFGSYLLSRVIVKPITKLVRATEKIADGNLDFKVEPFPSKEVDSLSQSFNKMTKNLLQSKETLQEHVDSLEKVNLELKQAKYEVVRSEKLASVGRLAAGIAHEVGNPLGSVFGYLDILSEDDGADLDNYIKRIRKECERIDSIVRELLDFSRDHSSVIQDVNINEVINDTCCALLHRKLFANIKCRIDLGADVPVTRLDKRQFQQVVTNLVINAADAFDKCDGEIILSTTSVKYKAGLFPSNTLKDGDEMALFTIRDTGCGIPREELDKIFDPFYTTKEPGKGTGLGLAISLRIIESFGGTITVDSVEGKGAAFNIYLQAKDLQAKDLRVKD